MGYGAGEVYRASHARCLVAKGPAPCHGCARWWRLCLCFGGFREKNNSPPPAGHAAGLTKSPMPVARCEKKKNPAMLDGAHGWGTETFGARPGNGAAAWLLSCERGSHRRTAVATRPCLRLAL